VGQHRSTHRHGGKVINLEGDKLRHRLREIAAEHIRWGLRMAYRLLAGGLDREPQAGATALSGGRLTAAQPQEAQASQAGGRLCAAPPRRASPPGVGHGLPV